MTAGVIGDRPTLWSFYPPVLSRDGSNGYRSNCTAERIRKSSRAPLDKIPDHVFGFRGDTEARSSLEPRTGGGNRGSFD